MRGLTTPYILLMVVGIALVWWATGELGLRPNLPKIGGDDPEAAA